MSQSLGDAVEEDYVSETGYLIDLHSLVLKLRNVYYADFSWVNFARGYAKHRDEPCEDSICKIRDISTDL